ncbi:hypothetical protein LNTAR_08449 [Lentisphaera araneosa HTCC2155]|uniref:Uncharacterized protein n=1 Tax=Lentisphaera araneosa HTCC2155 TaxID=313628 RepID=A6DHT1_9BACT|nr:hypothetical protein [Lentisphaera araneosa]EDM28585.1 hypothetical protein LNTAR_08449 [Lentisphaera araneosa HTCC2155]
MNKIKYLFFVSVLLIGALYAEQKKVKALTQDGEQYPIENLPNMLVTEFVFGQVKFLKKGIVDQTWASYGKCQDAWKLDDNSMLVSGVNGVWHYDKNNTRKLLFEPKKRPLEIHSCQPLDDGYVLIAVNGPKVILEISSEGKIRKMIKLPYLKSQVRSQMKMVRKLEDGGYIISASGENKVYILNAKGAVKRTIDLNTLEAPLKADRIHGVKMLANGNVLIGTGYGACLIEVDTKDQVVWSLNPADIPDVNLKYVGGFQVKENGNMVVAAYHSSYPLFEINRDKEIIWKLERSQESDIKKPTNVVLLGEDIEGFAANY